MPQQTPSHDQNGLQGVGRWRPALLFTLLPTLLLLGLMWALLDNAPAHAQTPSPTYSVDQVTPPAAPPVAAFGSGSFEQNCAACHGLTGQGDGPTVASLPYSPTVFADPEAVWSLAPAEMFHTTKFGRIERLMPPWGNQLNDDEIWSTVMYAWSLHTDANFVVSGQTLYVQSCAACHGETGAGDGPDAQGDLPNFGDLTAVMVQSQEDWLAGWQEAHPEIGAEWTLDEQRQVLEYIRTFSYIPAWESGYRPGAGVIRGTVTHGTAGETLPPGLVVTLDAYARFDLAESFTTTVDATGNFVFTDLSVEENISYIASTMLDGVRYSSPLVMLNGATPEADAPIIVYATSDDPPEIRINRLDWIIDNQPGAVLVAQLYFLGAGGDRTFVGAPVGGLNVPATVAIHIPPGAEEITFEGGVVGGRYQQVGDLYYDTAPLIPGEGTKQLVVRYLLPYDGTSLTYAQRLLYPTGETNLLIAELPGLAATLTPAGGAALEVTETQEFQERTYDIYRQADLPATEIEVAFDGLLAATGVDPREPAGAPTAAATAARAAPFAPWMAWSIGGLALSMIAGGVLWAWRSGRVQLAEQQPDVRQEIDGLARRIAQLDDLHALGQVDDATWQQQRRQLKTRLWELGRRLDERQKL